MPVEQIEIGFAFNKLDRTKDAQGRITIKFMPLLRTGELKIHCNYDDLDTFQLPVDRAEFMNSPEKLVTVYQKFAARTESYEYDALGNRTVERTLLRKKYGYTYTYYPNSNRLQSKVKQDGTERVDYAYDANGNLTSKIVTKGDKIDTWEYAYDLLNQLEQVKKNEEIVSNYIYDPNGFRVEKVGSKGKIHYVPLLNGEVGYRKELSTSKEYSFIYIGGQHLARVNGVVGGSGKKFYYHNDHLGSALAVTDENGGKIVERDFTPFGERINTDVYDDEPRDAEETEDGFTGKDLDEDVGLYYYNARWYDPGVGRFISEDLVADDPNLYGYCRQNPVNFIDPTGHFSVGLQSGWGLVGATVNAVALISGDENIGKLATAFNLFVAVKYYKASKAEKIAEAAKKNKPVTGPTERPAGTTNSEGGDTETNNETNINTENSTKDNGSSDTNTTFPKELSQQIPSTETATDNNTGVSETSEKPTKSVVSEKSEKQLEELSKVDPNAKKVYDDITKPIGVKFSLEGGEITYRVRGFEIKIEVLQEVDITKGTITVKFGADGKISSITDARGNKVRFIDRSLVKLAIGLAQPTSISFGKNSAFIVKTEISGEMNWTGRIMIHSTTIVCKATGQAIKVSVGPDIDFRPPAPQKAPVGIPIPVLPVVPIPLPI